MGVVSLKSALSWSFSGVQLRSTGVQWDLRKVTPYEIYSKLVFKIPYSFNGDSYDRYLLRIEELYQSTSIISQVINKIASGSIKVDDSKYNSRTRVDFKISMESLIHHFKLYTKGFVVNKGESYVGIEAPKGEFGVFLISNSSEIPYRCKIRAPGYFHLQAINYLIKGNLIADAVTIIGTLDIVFGEIDR